jgi:citrate lyase subunit beta/citryl-CoA lyase
MKPLRWQALLCVPASTPKLVASAIRHRPDAVILDLEDGVAAEAKPAARLAVRAHIEAIAGAGIDCVLRVNSGLRQMVEDLDAGAPDLLAAVMVPKCIDCRNLRNAGELLGENGTPLIALAESPAALPHLEKLSRAPGVAAMMFGPEDYAAELGVSADSPALEIPAALIAAAATAAGILAIGLPGSLANFANLDALAAKAARARALGFRAAVAIHPAQLPVLRQAFMPSQKEIDRARKVVTAFEQSGTGAIKLDGTMLDAPVVEQARRILALAAAS